MQIRDGEGDPTPAGLAAGGTVVVLVAAGGAAAAANGSQWIAPIIALIGAVFVAVLTAVTTNRRQARQLEEERTRQRQQLEDAAQRQREQLEHDRAMRRREEIIAVIADATAAGSRRFFVTDRAIDAWREGLSWDHPRTQELENERIAAVAELRGAWGRVQIRFAQDSNVRRRLEEWRDALDEYSDTVRKGLKEGLGYTPGSVEGAPPGDAGRRPVARRG